MLTFQCQHRLTDDSACSSVVPSLVSACASVLLLSWCGCFDLVNHGGGISSWTMWKQSSCLAKSLSLGRLRPLSLESWSNRNHLKFWNHFGCSFKMSVSVIWFLCGGLGNLPVFRVASVGDWVDHCQHVSQLLALFGLILHPSCWLSLQHLVALSHETLGFPECKSHANELAGTE